MEVNYGLGLYLAVVLIGSAILTIRLLQGKTIKQIYKTSEVEFYIIVVSYTSLAINLLEMIRSYKNGMYQ